METGIEVLKVETFQEIIKTAPDAIALNQTSVAKAEEYGKTLLEKVKAVGMNDTLDAELNNYQVKLKKTLQLMEGRRKPITGLFDEVKKAFTSMESRLNPKTVNGVYDQIQTLRNQYATKKAQEARKAQEEQQRKQAVELEKISVKTIIETQLKKYFIDYLTASKAGLNKLFEAITIDNIKPSEELIRNFMGEYPYKHFEGFNPVISPRYLKPEDIKDMLTDIKHWAYNDFTKEYREAIATHKEYLLDRVPSKYSELRQIANANEVEALMLENQAKERQDAEKLKLEKEASDRAIQIEQQATTNKSVMEANTLFDLQTQSSSAHPSGQVRSGYEIEVLHPAGYQLIAAKWFEKEGLKETDIIMMKNKTLGSMKAFCEKLAKDTGEKIVSEYLRYNETFKVVARK